MNKILLTHLVFIFLGIHFSGKATNPIINKQIDWESFLARHDLIWEQTPNDYFNAPFLGNGLLGTMLYCPEGEKFRLDIGRTDVVEYRDTEANSIVDNGRLPIGHFILEMNYDFQNATGRLDLFNAEANFEIGAKNGKTINLRSLIFKTFDAILVEYENPDELQCYWMFHPDASIVPRNPKVGTRHLNPPPEISNIDGINICTQKRDAGGSYTTAWKVIDTGNKLKRLIIIVEDSYPENESVKNAVNKIKQIIQSGKIEQQIKLHRNWWNNYYKSSFISIPHARMESVYWIQQYKFASMMRKNGPFCDLLGPWYKKTGWPGIWWNLNTQMLYSSLHISNQLELASTLPDYLVKMNDELIASVPEKWQYNSSGVSRCTGPAMKESILTWPSAESPERSNLTYLCYNLWEYYRTSMDEEYLQNHLFPLLKRSVNLMLHEVTVDENGIIHTPLGHCPESSDDADNNYDLSSLKWGCQTLLKIDRQLNLKDPLANKWQEIVEKLLPFPADENGYRSSVNKPVPLMHRHWCHLFQIYPYYIVNWEQPENKENILNSIKYWGSPEIPNTWTQAVISSMYSSIKDSENALKHMDLALASPNLSPNTFHAEGRNPCSETYGGLCRMLQDMLIQSWGDKIRIFPGVSNEWKDVVFHNLRAEGGFEVSAKRENGKTIWVRIKNNTGDACVLEPGFENKFKISGGRSKKISQDTYRLDIRKGEEVVLFVRTDEEFEVSPVMGTITEYNFFGLRK
ncbi:MAG: glycoside hydrolase family 95-like protein [Bacteroidota bacterium]